MKRDLLKEIKSKEDINHYNNLINEIYRPYDASNYLYNEILKVTEIKDKFSNQFIELIYATLSAWNMNTRGAKLNDFEDFKKTLREHKQLIIELSKYNLEKLKYEDFKKIMEKTQLLFLNLKLVGTNDNGKEKPILVTFSKTMHFLLPELFIPIDRTYTIRFFYNNTYLPKGRNKEFERFKMMYFNMYEYCKFLIDSDLKLKNKFGKNYTKTIDNIIIGYWKTQKIISLNP